MNQVSTAVATLAALGVSNAWAQQTSAPKPQRSATGQIAQANKPIADTSNRATALNNAFTYQGSLMDNGAPANGEYDIRFILYDDLGAVVAGPICNDNIVVTDGVFSTQLDFGPEFFGDVRELELAIRTGGALGNCDTGGGYTTLSPRQELTATPYALGLALPYAGEQSDPESVFSIFNSDLDADSAIRGVLGAPVAFPFPDGAGIRGEGSGAFGSGVIGVSNEYMGVLGYSVGPSGYGVFGRSDGTNGKGIGGYATESGGIGVYGVAFDGDNWAAVFEGRSYFDGNVGIRTPTPTTSLDVIGTTRTTSFQIPTNPGVGKVLKSDASGNATWQTANDANFSSGGAPNPTATEQFLSETTTVQITEGQSIFVTSTRAFGTTAVGGASSLDLFIGYRLSGSSNAPIKVGNGIYDLRLPQGSRVPFGLSAIISGLAPGIYEVGMVGDDDGDGNWNSNEFGYTTVIVLN